MFQSFTQTTMTGVSSTHPRPFFGGGSVGQETSSRVFIFFSEKKKMLAHVLFLISGVTQKIPIPVVSAI